MSLGSNNPTPPLVYSVILVFINSRLIFQCNIVEVLTRGRFGWWPDWNLSHGYSPIRLAHGDPKINLLVRQICTFYRCRTWKVCIYRDLCCQIQLLATVGTVISMENRGVLRDHQPAWWLSAYYQWIAPRSFWNIFRKLKPNWSLSFLMKSYSSN